MTYFWSKCIATYCFVGLLPKAPGTWGSIFALPLAWILHKFGFPIYGLVFSLLTILGIWASHIYSQSVGKDDPDEVVIDEVAGILMVYFFIQPTPVNLILGVILFRILDILKPPPIGWFEKLGGGLGIMADDIVAGLITGLILYSLQFLWT